MFAFTLQPVDMLTHSILITILAVRGAFRPTVLPIETILAEQFLGDCKCEALFRTF